MKAPRWTIALLAGMSSVVFGWEFAPPTEGPVAFRRDKVPLDEESIERLSRSLEVLARELPGESAKERRGAAQMLALSLALDPANATARELIADYKENRHTTRSPDDQVEKGRGSVWQLIGWLETPDAGSQGRALADCLKDVIILSDPKHPNASALRESGEKGVWAGWVPSLSAYEDKPKITEKTNPKDTSKGPADPPSANSPKLDHAEVQAMLWKNAGNSDNPKWQLAPAPLRMSVKKSEGDENSENQPFAIHIGSGEEWGMFENTNSTLVNLLSAQHKNLPEGIHVIITSKELGQSIASHKKQSISAASSVLASAAITGIEPDAIILGQIDNTGAYNLPSGFWNQIRSLGKGQGQRLILPAAAATMMPSLLSMENPKFFMEYEVLLAKDFTQLITLSAKKPVAETASALGKFGEILEKSGTQDFRLYINNRFVRQRLAEVVQEAPYHLSAKMLLVQAEGKRPNLIARKVLASEILSAIEPMAWISRNTDNDFSPTDISKLTSTYDTCRAAVDSLEHYADKADRALIDQSREVVLAIRNIERASRTRGEYYAVKEMIRSARYAFSVQANQLKDNLSIEAGDAPAP